MRSPNELATKREEEEINDGQSGKDFEKKIGTKREREREIEQEKESSFFRDTRRGR